MKKKRAILLAVLVVLAPLAIWYYWGPSTVPPGQQPLLALSASNFGEFAKAFDANTDRPRIVLLLSPT
jgi:hypothetical protein